MISARALPWVVAGLLVTGPSKARAAEHPLKTEALQSLLGIPTAMAIVTEGYVPKGQRFLRYVLIEDAHESTEAQGKIAAILLYAHHRWGTRQAFVEGAFGPIGPPPFPIFTPERGDRGILELLQDGLFSAGELAAALSTQLHENPASALIVNGMDDPLLYRAQLEAFDNLAAAQPAALGDLKQNSSPWTASQKEDFRRLVELRMTPVGYQRYLRSKQSLLLSPALARAAHWAETYYELADLRSKAFADTARRGAGNAPCLLVMGGFHTPAITKALRQRQDSFIVLSPRLTHQGHRRLYERCLVQTLQSLRAFGYSSPVSSPAGILRLSLARRTD